MMWRLKSELVVVDAMIVEQWIHRVNPGVAQGGWLVLAGVWCRFSRTPLKQPIVVITDEFVCPSSQDMQIIGTEC